MKVIIQRAVLSILAVLPISSIGVAAESKLISMENPPILPVLSRVDFPSAASSASGQPSNSEEQMMLRNLIPDGLTVISVDNSFRIFKTRFPHLEDARVEVEFERTVRGMIDRGMLKYDNMVGRSVGPGVSY